MKKIDKNFFAGVVGNVLEWYDFAVFGFVAPLIGSLFFPKEDKLVALLMTYGVFAIGYIARPIGGIIFGYIGDKYGRKHALQISMTAMAIPTVCIAFIPTYETMGIFATALLMFLRIIQGLSVGGELMGSVSYLVEIAPKDKKNFYGSFTLFSAVGGLLLGSGVVGVLELLISKDDMVSWGWRIPFVGGFFIFLVGLWIRKKMEESPDFLSNVSTQKQQFKTLFTEIIKMPKNVFRVFSLVSVATVSAYTLFVWMPTYMGDIIHSPIKDPLLLGTFSMIIVIIALPISGYMSDKYTPEKIFKLSSFFMLLLAYPIFWMTNQDSVFLVVLAQIIFALLVGFIQGPLPVLMTNAFPTRLRYSGIGLGYNIATAILGGTTPMMATMMIQISGSFISPAFYIMFFAVLAFVATYIKVKY